MKFHEKLSIEAWKKIFPLFLPLVESASEPGEIVKGIEEDVDLVNQINRSGNWWRSRSVGLTQSVQIEAPMTETWHGEEKIFDPSDDFFSILWSL